MTKLSSTLPKGEANGLEAINKHLIDHPDGAFIMVAVIDCKRITTDMDTGDAVATARLRRIEAVAPHDKDRAAQILVRATEHRTGATVLPIEIEDELRTLLASVNIETGELPAEDELPLDDAGSEDGDA